MAYFLWSTFLRTAKLWWAEVSHTCTCILAYSEPIVESLFHILTSLYCRGNNFYGVNRMKPSSSLIPFPPPPRKYFMVDNYKTVLINTHTHNTHTQHLIHTQYTHHTHTPCIHTYTIHMQTHTIHTCTHNTHTHHTCTHIHTIQTQYKHNTHTIHTHHTHTPYTHTHTHTIHCTHTHTHTHTYTHLVTAYCNIQTYITQPLRVHNYTPNSDVCYQRQMLFTCICGSAWTSWLLCSL